MTNSINHLDNNDPTCASLLSYYQLNFFILFPKKLRKQEPIYPHIPRPVARSSVRCTGYQLQHHTCSFLARSAGVSVHPDRSLSADDDPFVLNFRAVTPKFLPISGGNSVIHSSLFVGVSAELETSWFKQNQFSQGTYKNRKTQQQQQQTSRFPSK